jgi:hypothetical protein
LFDFQEKLECWDYSCSKLLLRKRTYGEREGKGGKEGKGGRGKKKACSKVVFLILLFTKY